MMRIHNGILGLVLGLLIASCNSTVVEQVSRAEKDSDAFITALKEKGDYKELTFLNGDESIFYKEIKDAPAANKGVHPYQNSTVAVTLRGEHAITGQEFQPEQKLASLVLYGNVSATSSQNLVEGVQIALQNMEVGDTWEVIVPWRLGYGATPVSSLIPAYSPLKFTLTLDQIVKP